MDFLKLHFILSSLLICFYHQDPDSNTEDADSIAAHLAYLEAAASQANVDHDRVDVAMDATAVERRVFMASSEHTTADILNRYPMLQCQGQVCMNNVIHSSI